MSELSEVTSPLDRRLAPGVDGPFAGVPERAADAGRGERGGREPAHVRAERGDPSEPFVHAALPDRRPDRRAASSFGIDPVTAAGVARTQGVGAGRAISRAEETS